MESIRYTKDGILVESEYFDAASTILSGQCFRFKQTDNGFDLISGDKKCSLTTADNRTFIKTDHKDYFYNYFDLGTEYHGIVRLLSGFPELSGAVQKGRGIHILRQELFETIISFIISANNNIPRIMGIIERLCTKYGTSMDGFYAFPTPSQLVNAAADDYKLLGAGYRADYLTDTVRLLNQSDILQRLPQADYESSLKLLMTLKGVGRKVADCICLFSLFHTECYPVDTWIKKTDGDISSTEARQRGMQRYGCLAGYAQQYKYYAARAKNKL